MKVTDTMQGGILKAHGRSHCNYLFLRFNAIPKEESNSHHKDWLKEFTLKFLTTHERQVEESHEFNKTGIQFPVISIGFTTWGLQELMGGELPTLLKDTVFSNGMANEITRRYLNDYNIEYCPNFMEDDQQPKIGALIMIAAASTEMADDYSRKIKEIKGFDKSIYLHFSQYGFRGSSKHVTEFSVGPFGYADGLSESRSQEELKKETCFSEGDLSDSSSYGSFLAFRKLKINRSQYIGLVNKLSSNSRPNNYSEALIMGRFKDGTPLTMFKQPADLSEWREKGPDNENRDRFFDYEMDRQGTKCPIHAHVRKMNPRDGSGEGAILRRSMLFTNGEDWPSSSNFEIADGMLFTSYQRSLTKQFIPLFQKMKPNEVDLNPDFIAYRDPMNDNLIGTFPTEYKKGLNPDTDIYNSAALTDFMGGEFFYMPAKSTILNYIIKD